MNGQAIVVIARHWSGNGDSCKDMYLYSYEDGHAMFWYGQAMVRWWPGNRMVMPCTMQGRACIMTGMTCIM
jgi:hypothetical protein